MNKLRYLVYPTVVLLSLAAALPTQSATSTEGSGCEISPPQVLGSNTSRAQRRAELTQARADGTLLSTREGEDLARSL